MDLLTKTRRRLFATGGSLLRSRALRCFVLPLLLSTFASPSAVAQAASADEYEIRAAMLLNLTKFIDWPPSKFDNTHPEFRICVLGQDPINPYVDRFFRNQSVGARPIRVEHLSTLETASGCNMLYVGAGVRKNLGAALAELARSSVLVLSERSNASSPNQVIGLPSIDEHVHIEVDLGEAQRAGLTFSSKLLRLATVTR